MLPRKCNVKSIKLRKLKKIRINYGDPIKGGTPIYKPLPSQHCNRGPLTAR